MAIPKMNYSFKPGCDKVTRQDYLKLRMEIMDLLGCKTLQHFYKRRAGIPNISVQAKSEIEKIFQNYDVSPEDVWEITEVKDESTC